MEIADIMQLVKIWRPNTMPTELDQVGMEIAACCGALARNSDIKLYSYEQAFQVD
jgi:hypothetical protein